MANSVERIMQPKRVYLAGPDVFRPDALAWGEEAKGVARRFGLDATFPLDDAGKTDHAARIFAACIRQLAQADAVVANLTPFRGVSADVGTAFELGWAHANEYPLFAWSSDTRPLIERVSDIEATQQGRRVDAKGWQVEDFHLADNLMLIEALAAPIRTSLEDAMRDCADWFEMAGAGQA